MLASDVVAIVNEPNGLTNLAQMFAISRRGAEQLATVARRAQQHGLNPVLSPGDSLGALSRPQVVQEPTEDDQALDDLEQAAQDQARRIKHESYGIAQASIANMRSRLAVLERNIRAGYGQDWDFDYRLTKRTLELVEGVTL